MTMSNQDSFYAWLDHEGIRNLVHRSNELTPGERMVLIKGLVPGLVNEIGADEFEEFAGEILTKARRFEEAQNNPGQGSGTREVPGERLGGPTPEGQVRLSGHREPNRPGGRAEERRFETDAWARRTNIEPGEES